MFRRMIALLLSALVLLSLSGCSGIDLSALLSAAESAQQTSQASGPASSAKPSGTPEEVPAPGGLAEEGGVLKGSDGVAVEFTPGLNVPEDTPLTVVRGKTVKDEELGASYTAYDISMGDVHDLGGYVTIRLPYREDGIEGGQDPAQCVAGMYLNEETGEWESVLYDVDTENRELLIHTDHFSTYGAFVFENVGKRSARVVSIHDWMLAVDQSQCAKALQEILDNNGEPGVECREVMRPVLEDSFSKMADAIGAADDKATVVNNLSTLFINGTLLGDAVGNMEWANGITSALSYAGIATAVASLGAQALKADKTDKDIAAMYKSAVYLLGSLTQDATIGVIGASVWVIDKGITDMGEYAYNKISEDTTKAYRHYYSKYMTRSRTDWRWALKDVARAAIKNQEKADTAIMDEIDRWCGLFWDIDSTTYTHVLTDIGQEGRGWPDDATKRAITADYKGDLLRMLEPILEEVQRDLEQDLWREQQKRVEKFREKLNSVLTFEIQEEVEKGKTSAYEGYTVSFWPLNKWADKSDWQFTKGKGETMKVETTLIGYLLAGPPVEVRYYQKGKSPDKDKADMTVPFKMTAPKTVIRIQKKAQEELPPESAAQEEWVDPYQYYNVKDIVELYPKLREKEVLKLKVKPVAYDNNGAGQVELISGGEEFILDKTPKAVTTYKAKYKSHPKYGSQSTYDLTMTFTAEKYSSDIFEVSASYTEKTASGSTEKETVDECIIFNYQVDTEPEYARKGIIIDNHTTVTIAFVVTQVLISK